MRIDDQEFAAYVLGDAPADLAMRIEQEAIGDEGLAAEFAAFAPLALPSSVVVLPATSSAPRTKRWRPVPRAAVLAAGILLAVCGVAWGGYELLRTRPLLEDDFHTGTIEYSKWDLHLGRRGVSGQDGYLRLLNRGSLVTRQEFDGPVEVTFDWRWVDHGQWPLYAEVLTVALHTTGQHKDEHDYLARDGFLVDFNTATHNVCASIPGQPLVLYRSPPDSLPLVAGQWHHVRIVDDGSQASVFVTGPSIDPRYQKEPVLTAPIPRGLVGRHIGFFNREHVGDTNHESQVDNVKVWELGK